MPGVLFQQPTEEVEAWLAARRAKGLDQRDEMWEGVYVVMAPAPSLRHGWLASQLIALLIAPAASAGLRVADAANIGSAEDYRIPDVVVFDPADADSTGTWLATARVAVEIRSPGEAHEEKLPFYAGRGVDEVVSVDPDTRALRWLARSDRSDQGEYMSVERSAALGLDVGMDVVSRLRWE